MSRPFLHTFTKRTSRNFITKTSHEIGPRPFHTWRPSLPSIELLTDPSHVAIAGAWIGGVAGGIYFCSEGRTTEDRKGGLVGGVLLGAYCGAIAGALYPLTVLQLNENVVDYSVQKVYEQSRKHV